MGFSFYCCYLLVSVRAICFPSYQRGKEKYVSNSQRVSLAKLFFSEFIYIYWFQVLFLPIVSGFRYNGEKADCDLRWWSASWRGLSPTPLSGWHSLPFQDAAKSPYMWSPLWFPRLLEADKKKGRKPDRRPKTEPLMRVIQRYSLKSSHGQWPVTPGLTYFSPNFISLYNMSYFFFATSEHHLCFYLLTIFLNMFFSYFLYLHFLLKKSYLCQDLLL